MLGGIGIDFIEAMKQQLNFTLQYSVFHPVSNERDNYTGRMDFYVHSKRVQQFANYPNKFLKHGVIEQRDVILISREELYMLFTLIMRTGYQGKQFEFQQIYIRRPDTTRSIDELIEQNFEVYSQGRMLLFAGMEFMKRLQNN